MASDERGFQFKEAEDTSTHESSLYNARLLAQEPHRIVEFASQLRSETAIAKESESPEYLASIHLYSKSVLRAFSLVDWKDLETQEFSEISAICLLDELSRTENSTDETDVGIRALTEQVLDGWINSRFEKSQNWIGALQSLHTLTSGALSDTENITRIDTWANLLLDKHPKILQSKKISRLGLFFAFRDPSPKNEECLRIGMDINNALSTVASTSGREDDFHRQSAEIVSRYHPSLDRAIEKSKYPREFREAFRSTAKDIDTFYPRYLLLIDFINKRYGDPSSNQYSIRADAINQYPNYIVLEQTFLRKQTHIIEGMDSLKASLVKSVEESARQFDPNSVIAPFAKGGFSGYFFFRPNTFPGETPDDQADFILETLNTNELRVYLDEVKETIASNDGTIGLTYNDPTYGEFKVYIFTREHVFYLEQILDQIIPTELRREGIGLLRENLRLQREIGLRFSRSLTRKGLYFDLREFEELPYVFDHVILKRNDHGLFDYTIGLPNTDDIIGTISMINGAVKASLSGDATKLPPDISWVLNHLALKLFYHSCCIELRDIKPPGYVPDEGESHYDRDEVPAEIVRVGGYRGDGSPKRYRDVAVANHLLDSYNIEFEPNTPLETMLQVAAEMHVKTLVDYNNEYRNDFPDRDEYLTWRSAHETGKTGNPSPAVAPENLFVFA